MANLLQIKQIFKLTRRRRPRVHRQIPTGANFSKVQKVWPGDANRKAVIFFNLNMIADVTVPNPYPVSQCCSWPVDLGVEKWNNILTETREGIFHNGVERKCHSFFLLCCPRRVVIFRGFSRSKKQKECSLTWIWFASASAPSFRDICKTIRERTRTGMGWISLHSDFMWRYVVKVTHFKKMVCAVFWRWQPGCKPVWWQVKLTVL